MQSGCRFTYKCFTSALFAIIACCVSLQTFATEIIHYKNLPVIIALRQGEERSIQFGDHVQVGITKAQQAKKWFRLQSAQGVLHILPHKTFDKQRIQVKRLGDGRVVLLDLIASEASPNARPLEDIRLLLASENTVPKRHSDANFPAANPPRITPVKLTRYASQRLYGPTRLHRDNPNISEIPVGFVGPIKLFKGPLKFQTQSQAVLAYQGGGYYLAAIHIKNLSTKPLPLNYLDLNLPFSHATLQHHRLHPQGSPGDSTILYLVTERPIKEHLYPVNYYQDKTHGVESPHVGKNKNNDHKEQP